MTDNGCSLDESFGSDGQIHERIKDINIISKEDDTKVGHRTKMKEADLRQSIRDKLCSVRKDDDPTSRHTDSRPGVIISYFHEFSTLLSRILNYAYYFSFDKLISTLSWFSKKGDGESVPETPPNEEFDDSSSTESKKGHSIQSTNESRNHSPSTENHNVQLEGQVKNPFSIQVWKLMDEVFLC